MAETALWPTLKVFAVKFHSLYKWHL